MMAIVNKDECTKDQCFLWDKLKISCGFLCIFLEILKGNTPLRLFLWTAEGGRVSEMQIIHLWKCSKGSWTNLGEEVRACSAAGYLIREQFDGIRGKRNAKTPVAIYYPSKGQGPRPAALASLTLVSFPKLSFCWGLSLPPRDCHFPQGAVRFLQGSEK